MTKILTPEKIIRYAETRLFGDNVRPHNVKVIELHNGVLPSSLEEMLNQRCGGFQRVLQENSREPIYFRDGRLFIPQYSGFGRRKRYESMIKAYLQVIGEDIGFKSCELEGDERKTNIEYDNLAYDFVVGLFVPEDKYEDRRVFDTEIQGVTHVIFGSLDAVAKQADVVERENTPYLGAQLVKIGEELVLNIGYVYADQAGIIIDKMLREYEALARKQNKKLRIGLYMFGRVGGLKDEMKRHQLVSTAGIIDEVDLLQNRHHVYPMHNVLLSSPDRHRGLNLNVTSVIHETVEQLEQAREWGCISIDMETRESVESVNRARRRYEKLDINFGFMGYISDLPLKGDTLADELDSDKGEQAAVAEIVKAVRQG